MKTFIFIVALTFANICEADFVKRFTIGDQILIDHACEDLRSLLTLKPFIDSPRLEASVINYSSLLIHRRINCYDGRLFGTGLAVEVELEYLLMQTYIGDNKMVQYWVASFPDKTTVYVWFAVQLREI